MSWIELKVRKLKWNGPMSLASKKGNHKNQVFLEIAKLNDYLVI